MLVSWPGNAEDNPPPKLMRFRALYFLLRPFITINGKLAL